MKILVFGSGRQVSQFLKVQAITNVSTAADLLTPAIAYYRRVKGCKYSALDSQLTIDNLRPEVHAWQAWLMKVIDHLMARGN